MINRELQEKVDKAEAAWKRVSGKYPDGDRRLLDPMLKLAGLYHQTGRRREALPLFRRCLALYESAGIKEEEKLDTIMESLAVALSMDGQYPEALHLFDRLLEIRKRRQGPESLGVGRVLCHLGTIRRSMNMTGEAEKLLLRSLGIAERHGRKGWPLLSMICSNLTGVYREQKKPQMAMECCRRSIELENKLGGAETIKQAGRYNNLGRLHLDLGQRDKAEECYLKSLEIRKKHFGHFHPDLVHNLVNLGELYCLNGDFDRAEQHLFQAMAVAEKTLSPSDPLNGFVLLHLANLCAARGYYETAEGHYHRALEIIEGAMGTNFPEVGIIHLKLAQLMQRNGLWELSLEEAAKAREILEKVDSLDAPERKEMEEMMARALRELGRHREADEILKKAEPPSSEVSPGRSGSHGAR